MAILTETGEIDVDVLLRSWRNRRWGAKAIDYISPHSLRKSRHTIAKTLRETKGIRSLAAEILGIDNQHSGVRSSAITSRSRRTLTTSCGRRYLGGGRSIAKQSECQFTQCIAILVKGIME
jgi:hypothetical protein